MGMAVPEKYQEIETKLDQPLRSFVELRRAQGTSWRRIAVDIWDRTGVDITYESLRMWFQGREPVEQPEEVA